MLLASAAQAQSLLRDTSHFQWDALPLFLLVLYIYNEQIVERRWSVVLGGVAFWLMDWVNEIGNGLIAHFSGYAPLWGTPNGHSSLVLLIGLNLEITLMFAVMGLMAVRMLPAQRGMRLFGVSNRLLLALGNSLLCVIVEIWLNHIGVLTWEWSIWGRHAPWLIFLIGYLPFFGVAYWVHDMPSRAKQVTVVGCLAGGVALSLLLFGGLGWL